MTNRIIIGRILALIPAVGLQVLFFYIIFKFFKDFIPVTYSIICVAAVMIAVYILSKREPPAYKQVWLFFILLFPMFGAIMYLLIGNKRTGTALRNKINASKKALNYEMPASDYVMNNTANEEWLRSAGTIIYGYEMSGMPLYKCGDTRYYPLGDDMFPDMLEDIKKAKKFIYMEYFIVNEGVFWNTIVDALAEKVKEGVDVRFMYDDLGSIATYSKKNVETLRNKGIKCISFNPIKYLTFKINNRDHRKMTIIDGETGYSGGVNIADEYINEREVYGHWKDIGFRVTGDAVIPYTYMFTEFWNAFSRDKIPQEVLADKATDLGENGFVFSYYESPVHNEHISNGIYIDLLAQATNYVWFYTPYLMIDDSLIEAMIRAARRGVDIRIIMPGIPDKKLVYRISRSYYSSLLEYGIRIFEYEPGFVHAKAVICDDKLCTIGTVNLDYRSLFLHFENNTIFAKCSILEDLKKDYEDTLTKCRERKLNDGLAGSGFGFIDVILRIFAPLL